MLNGFVEQIKVTRLSLLLGRHMSMFFSHSCEFCEIFMNTLVVYRPPMNNPGLVFLLFLCRTENMIIQWASENILIEIYYIFNVYYSGNGAS